MFTKRQLLWRENGFWVFGAWFHLDQFRGVNKWLVFARSFWFQSKKHHIGRRRVNKEIDPQRKRRWPKVSDSFESFQIRMENWTKYVPLCGTRKYLQIRTELNIKNAIHHACIPESWRCLCSQAGRVQWEVGMGFVSFSISL